MQQHLDDGNVPPLHLGGARLEKFGVSFDGAGRRVYEVTITYCPERAGVRQPARLRGAAEEGEA